MLEGAIDAGYRNRHALRTDESLAALRGRDDFQQLVIRMDNVLQSEQSSSNEPTLSDQGTESRRKVTDVLRQLIGSDAADLRRRKTLAATLYAVGEIQAGLKQYAEAEQSLLASLEIRRALLDKQPGDPHAALEILVLETALGRLQWSQGEYAQAHQRWQACLADSLRLAHAHKDNKNIQEGIGAQESKIFECYGRIGLWPQMRGLWERNVRFRRGNLGLLSGTFSAVLLALNDLQLARSYFGQFALTLPDEKRAFQVAKLACGFATVGEMTEELDAKARSVLEQYPQYEWVAARVAAADYQSGKYASAQSILERFRSSSGIQISYLDAAVAAKLGDAQLAHDRWTTANQRYRKTCRDALDRGVADDIKGIFHRNFPLCAFDQVARRLAAQSIGEAGSVSRDPWQHLIQARGYRLIGENEKADAELAAAVGAAPDDPEIWMVSARLRSEAGNQQHVAESDWAKVVALAGDDPLPWIHRGRWYAERGEHEKADADFAQAAALTPDELNKFLEAGWWVVGPYPPNLDALCPPELDPDPSKPVRAMNPATGLSEEPIAWRSAPSDETGNVQLGEFDEPNSSSIYLMTYVYAPTQRTMTLRMTKGFVGPDPSYRVWVNGQPCSSTIWKDKGMYRKFLITPLALRMGRNVILVKLSGAWKADNLPIRLNDHPVERAFDFLRAGLLDDAEELLATRYTNQLHDEWRHLDFKYNFAGRRYPDVHAAIHQDAVASADPSRETVVMAVFSQDHAVPQETLLAVANREDTAANMQKHYWIPTRLALIYLRANRWKDALRMLGQMKNSSNELHHAMSAIAHHHLGQADTASQMLALSIANFELRVKEVQDSGDHTPVARHLSRRYWMAREAQATIEGDTEEVDRLYEQFLHHCRKQWNARDPATAEFDNLVLLMPEEVEPYLARGRRRAQLGRWEEAEADFSRAVELARQDYRPLLAKAELRLQRAQISEAATDFAAALQLADEEDRHKHGRLVEAAVRRHAAVLDELEDRQDPNWRRLRGERESLLGNWSEAARALAASGRHTDAISLAALHCVSGDAAGYQETVDRLPQFLNEQLEEEALRDYWQAVSLGLRRESDPATVTELLRLAKLAADANPNDARYPFAVGLAYFRGQQYEAALDPLQQSLKIPVQDVDDLTDHALSWAVLAMACFQLDRPDEARDWLARCHQWRDLSTRRAISAFQGNSRAGRGLGDHRWNVAHALAREAELLINGAGAVARDDKQRQATLAALVGQTAASGSQTAPRTE